MDTPERGDILKRREAYEERSLGLEWAEKDEKSLRKARKMLAICMEFLYNMPVVCLWDEAVSCRSGRNG